MPSMLWAARTALVALFTAPAAATGAELFDGPRRVGDTPKRFLVVGADNDDPFAESGEIVDTLTGTARQGWSPEGPGTWRQEDGSILCVAVAWSGDDDFAPLRAAVEAIVDGCEAALLANRQLAGAVGAGGELAEISLWERRAKNATAVGAVFSVAYQSILT